ncbi:hypothetical protein NT26_p10050 (plasmid) [Pseudorhizobium banfieldiae]|uniref:Uncharacterized protein n=1 Tax=Pseudorhizobium banfieldiae TaxID=1125847 RepID=L0NLY1_9HYPH|nr:hypothetical protein NT26_p10050 [Pseudorhizobium banfieldiae]
MAAFAVLLPFRHFSRDSLTTRLGSLWTSVRLLHRVSVPGNDVGQALVDQATAQELLKLIHSMGSVPVWGEMTP